MRKVMVFAGKTKEFESYVVSKGMKEPPQRGRYIVGDVEYVYVTRPASYLGVIDYTIEVTGTWSREENYDLYKHCRDYLNSRK